ncbi:hypothetical protein ARALYDRAFT_898686 [Arabidopsis lyrata subsp. lyrata]|uniref:Uncharacterized protein n=2 Tax=Arabidopsis lyrata subsp. lyrata TaxID=81972 RepID=D7L1L8_ARALL|nr:cysteine-rich and transmembrane domain-containing protein PCC1 isoform X2 [Arabidopsis lyrata subsp. lyrata]EFH61748.1 hypothetical protein ARALYDRAFT_898686 [Arabidopsis lyrata subsp. lyrata]|eukprot:XP_002885489.1 cysteine-rich and transmembrane domain-containing protein PCC1 isoform X2 [Arabidopsis lyrata subsp. lyrata]
MNQSEHNDFSGTVQRSSQTSSESSYTSPPPPIGYPTRDAVVGDPPAVATETKSKNLEETAKICGCLGACCNCLTACCNFLTCVSG